jgi:hypothetical protein
MARRHPLAAFTVLAYALSWSVWIGLTRGRLGFERRASSLPAVDPQGLPAASALDMQPLNGVGTTPSWQS